MAHRSRGRRSRTGMRVGVGMAVLLAVAGLAACSSDSDADPATTEADGAGTTVADGATEETAAEASSDGASITHWQHHSDARAAIVEDFIASYGDAGGSPIEFESIPYGDYFTRLGAALEAGTGPCVFQLPANILNEFQASR